MRNLGVTTEELARVDVTVEAPKFWENWSGILLAILPPGAFIGLGCLIAVKNVLDARAKRRAEARPVGVLHEAGV